MRARADDPVVIKARFIAEQEDDGYVIYVEMEPVLAFASAHMEPDSLMRFELAVRRAAMRNRGGPPRKQWWKR